MYESTSIIGRLGSEPELRYTPTGKSVCNFSVATDNVWSDKEGVKHSTTKWWNVTVWGKVAEACAKYLEKGSTVFVVGNVTASGYAHKATGEIRASLEINALAVRFLSGKGTGKEVFDSEDSDTEKIVSDDNSIPF